MVDRFEDLLGEDLAPLTPEEERELHQGYLDSLMDLCDYDPKTLKGKPIGMLHCPKCGCMILAGTDHPKCDPDLCDMSVFQK